REHSYGTENPGYRKPAKIYRLNDVRCELIGMDKYGMDVGALEESGVSVAHISPAHHFPTGIVMPISRRREIMAWARSGRERYIIEDDYDSEFRWSGRPLPTMFGMDDGGRVIYINTFSQTIAPSVRISYMCLPNGLYGRWQERMGFYSCSVPAFEQYTLARFISEGYFERHINRSKKRYRRIRELVLGLMESFGDSVSVNEENAGLHFTMKTDEPEVLQKCALCGISVRPLRDYYGGEVPAENEGVYVVSYAGADEERLTKI
ncbi:MAG: PLP-dependent aminotransferase family protein, partial [Oscillospiraceae bacterium]|nr:PLP-dependent aminotransferase family protein [Oscillospiraceae bacterium]